MKTEYFKLWRIISHPLVTCLADKEIQDAERQKKILPNCGAVLLLPASLTYPGIPNSSISDS